MFPAEGSRDNKIPKFDGDTLGWEEDAGGSGDATRQLPALPSPGSRNDRIPKFNGDTLGWEYGEVIVDDPSAPLAASAQTLDKVLYRGRKLYSTVEQHATDPTATYRSFATSDLPNGYAWGGAHQVDPSPASLAINTVIYSIPGQHFLRRVSLGGTAYWGGYNPANWRGAWGSESEADQHIKAVGDIVYFGGIVRVATAYTAGTADGYVFSPIYPDMQIDLRGEFDQSSTPAAQDRFFFTDENQSGDPIRYVTFNNLASGFVTDDRVLDLAQSSRGSSDRGKLLATSAGNENDLVLIDNPASQVFRPRGAFAVRTAYAVNDVVAYSGHLYYVATAVPASNTANPVDGTTWILLSADPTPTATQSRQGTVELASTAEMNAGSGNRVPEASTVKTYVDAQVGPSKNHS